jgi:catechol 2,3-dioxygenase-like lactoylglutathione lyase family enzyme
MTASASGSATADREGRVLSMALFRRTVTDLDRAVAFYCDALGFELDIVVAGDVSGARRAVLTLGDEILELIVDADSPALAKLSRDTSSSSIGFQHIAIVAADMPAAFSRLMNHSPRAISTGGPVLLPPATGSVTAFKFRDPDGHPLELIHFPAGTGDPKWQRLRQGSTIGIDHSAIVVADVERSIAFYADLLGFSVASRELNRGPGQDALDGASGIVVDVIALTAAESATPHLELLGYRHPTSGASSREAVRRRGGDQIVWAVSGLKDILARLAVRDAERGRSSPVAQRTGELLVFDPDRHAQCLVDRLPLHDERAV